MRISDWSSDVCSSDLLAHRERVGEALDLRRLGRLRVAAQPEGGAEQVRRLRVDDRRALGRGQPILVRCLPHRARASAAVDACRAFGRQDDRSEEHTSELQSLMRSSYADLCFNKTHTDRYQQKRKI